MVIHELSLAKSSALIQHRKCASSRFSFTSVHSSVEGSITSVEADKIAIQQNRQTTISNQSDNSSGIIIRLKLSTLQPILPIISHDNPSPGKKHTCAEEIKNKIQPSLQTNIKSDLVVKETSIRNAKALQSTNPELSQRSLSLRSCSTGRLENKNSEDSNAKGSKDIFVHNTIEKNSNFSNSTIIDQGKDKVFSFRQRQTAKSKSAKINLEDTFPKNRQDTKTRKDLKSSSQLHLPTALSTFKIEREAEVNNVAKMVTKEIYTLNEARVPSNENDYAAAQAATKRSANSKKSIDSSADDTNGREKMRCIGGNGKKYQETLNDDKRIIEEANDGTSEKFKHSKIINPLGSKDLSYHINNDIVEDKYKAIHDSRFTKNQNLKFKHDSLNEAVGVSEAFPKHNTVDSKVHRSNPMGMVPTPPLHTDGLESESVGKILPQHEQGSPMNGLNSILGKVVRVVNGKFVGKEGKVKRIATRGWLILDNPALAGHKIQARQCELIENGRRAQIIIKSDRKKKLRSQKKVGEDVIRQFGKNEDCTVASQDNNTNSEITEGSASCEDSTDLEQTRRVKLDFNPLRSEKSSEKLSHNQVDKQVTRKARPRRAASCNISYKYEGDIPSYPEYHWQHLRRHFAKHTKQSTTKNSPTSFDHQFDKSKTLSFRETMQKKNRRTLDLSGQSPGNNVEGKKWNRQSFNERKRKHDGDERPFHSHHKNSKHGLEKHIHRPSLAPILINCEDNTLLPEALRHLPSDFKVEIFNRKTGLVMSGDEAVLVKDLPFLLQNHAEYEPVIPPPKALQNAFSEGNETVLSREGRSSPRIRVNAEIIPQSRVRASAVERRFVAVIAGPYSGLVGRVEACMPGGWYLIADLLHNDRLDLDVVIHSSKLELIPSDEELESIKGKSSVTSLHEQWTSLGPTALSNEKYKYENNKYAKLRVDALQEEKRKIGQMICEYKKADGTLTSVEGHDMLGDLSKNGSKIVKQTVSDMIDFIESKGRKGRYSYQGSQTKSSESVKSALEDIHIHRLHQEMKRINVLLLSLNSEPKFVSPISKV